MNIFRAKSIAFILLAAILVVQVAPLSSLAAESTFTTSLTTFGADTTAPTDPTNLVATAVSSSQIDLTWNSSTDDVLVAGYEIYRDLVLIATIPGATYSDTGLAPLTQYSYYVRAVDSSNNFSGPSNTAYATTTAQVIVTPPSSSGSGASGSTILYIYGLNIPTEEHSAQLAFNTNVSTQAKVYWGKTENYELGSISVLFYGTHHDVSILGLNPNTQYYVKIEATDSRGYSVFNETSFVTKSPVIVSPLPNPTNFTANPFDTYIQLGWNNPSDPRFDQVRLVRSDKFFPKDVNDGQLIYEGRTTSFKDADVKTGTTYYYALFAKSTDGSYSSGALAQARIVAKGEIATKPGADPFESLPEATRVDPIIKGLTLADFEFIQQGRTLLNVGNETIAINGGIPLTIRLKYDKVPEILKTIAFTLNDPQESDKVFPFLLRVNADKTYYEATIGSLGRSGNYAMSIVVLDYQNQGLKRLRGNIRALVFSAPADIRRGLDPVGFLFLIGLVIVLIVLASRKRRDDNQHPMAVLPSKLVPISTENDF